MKSWRSIRMVAVCAAATLTACARYPALEAAPSRAALLEAVSVEDRAVYEAVIAHLALEYTYAGDTVRVLSSTMEVCDPTSPVYHLDCWRDRDVSRLAQPWANGRRAFETLLVDSTRRELADSLRINVPKPQRLTRLDPSRFRLRTREQIAAEGSAGRAGRDAGTIIVARAARSSDGYAYVYAVYNRQSFATGIIYLLRKDADGWRVLERRGVWVT